jgi:spermidine dehydrogenase
MDDEKRDQELGMRRPISRRDFLNGAAIGIGGVLGFDPARDIDALTVNRWAHGYAHSYNSLFDPDWTEAEKPWVIGRKPFGQIAIANSDAGASAYTDAAIDQAYRAITELAARKT